MKSVSRCQDDELNQFDDFNENVLEAERAILALNRAGFDAVDGSLDDGIAGVGDLEGATLEKWHIYNYIYILIYIYIYI